MGFREGSYASVFSVTRGRGNFYDVNIATSRKDRSTNNYVTDFRGFVRFVGDAAKKIAKLDGRNSKDNGNKPVSRIKLGAVDVTNSYSEKDKKAYVNFVVFTFDFPDEKGDEAPKTKSTANDYVNSVPAGDEEDLFT